MSKKPHRIKNTSILVGVLGRLMTMTAVVAQSTTKARENNHDVIPISSKSPENISNDMDTTSASLMGDL